MKVEHTKEADEVFHVKIYFHWVKRFAEKLQQDAQRVEAKKAKEAQE